VHDDGGASITVLGLPGDYLEFARLTLSERQIGVTVINSPDQTGGMVNDHGKP